MAFAFEQLRARGEIVEVALGALRLGLHPAPLGKRGVLRLGPVDRILVRHPARASSIVCSKLASIG